jgi:hypothetical protein
MRSFSIVDDHRAVIAAEQAEHIATGCIHQL